MTFSPLSLSRRHVLGELYARCESLTTDVPVYLSGEDREVLGHVNEGLGHYADAFCFHLADDVCKKLSAGHYAYSFECTPTDPQNTGSRSRVSIDAITLTAGKPYEKPLAKR